MSDALVLDIYLHDRPIGKITRIDGDRSIFAFDDAYLADEDRPTLSLAYKDQYGAVINEPHPYQTRIEPWFSNQLPEGVLRQYLAQRAGIKAVREFPLLAQLGSDLPGAVRAIATDSRFTEESEAKENEPARAKANALRFSLAGVQLKFSALKNAGKGGGLTIPVSGAGGDWIVKLPSSQHVDVPENEHAAMLLARRLGIDTPDVELIGIEDINGLPDGIELYGSHAYAIKRFDRSPDGPLHIEDFAQVFGIFADDKYEKASYHSILSVLAAETSETDIMEYVRRLTYSVLIGNGDMHLKNWSLIYRDGRSPSLAPAYDLLSTLPYVAGDDSALKFHNSRSWSSFSYEELERLADRAKVPSHLVARTAKETVERFDAVWHQDLADFGFSRQVIRAIEKHRSGLRI
jgi:serine/threonine-protein kinase HipA